MQATLFTAVIFICIFLVIAVFWRYGSRRSSIPCPVWLRWMVEMDNPFTKTNRAATIIANMDLKPAMKVIDVGCGPGRLAIPVAMNIGKEGKLTAMDIQPGMLEIVREKAKKAGLANIEILQAGAGEGKLAAGQFDRALLVTVLGEIPNRTKALEEIYSALKPGGLLSVTEIIFDPHFQRYSTVKVLAEAAGFRVRAFFGNAIAYTVNLEK